MSSTFFERLVSFKLENETVEHFCARLGISRSAFHRYAKGVRPSNPFTVVALADKLGVSPGWLGFGREAVPPAPERLR